jgi:flavorubredoxin
MYRKLTDKIYNVGSIDWDRRIFDQLVSIPNGTTYNSYLIQGSEKTAIIDSVDPSMFNDLEKNLKDHNVKNLDFIICNHAEQDHSGSIPMLLSLFPKALVVTNEKCKLFLMDLLDIPEKSFSIVKDNDILSLGDLSLQFCLTPWVHWPETMTTYCKEEKVLFSCDFFGSHVATSDLLTDQPEKYIGPAKHYFAEIMMPFRTIITKNIQKISQLDIGIIAPSHGPSYKNPKPIIDAYKEWCSGETKPFVAIAYVSMHDSTKTIIEYIAKGIMDGGLDVKIFNLANSEIGGLATSLVDCSTLILGSPTVLAGAHPLVIYAAFLANALRPKLKYISIVGSYGWGGKMIDQITKTIPMIKAEVIEPVLCKGIPKDSDYKNFDLLVKSIIEKNQ